MGTLSRLKDDLTLVGSHVVYHCQSMQGHRQVLEFGVGGLSGGEFLRGVSLFVSRMLLPSFGFFNPKIWGGGLKPPKPPLPTPLQCCLSFRDREKEIETGDGQMNRTREGACGSYLERIPKHS